MASDFGTGSGVASRSEGVIKILLCTLQYQRQRWRQRGDNGGANDCRAESPEEMRNMRMRLRRPRKGRNHKQKGTGGE